MAVISEELKSAKKIAVVFPGVGYHTDKPLLYYSKRLAIQYGYEIVEVSYRNLPRITSDSLESTMKEAFEEAFIQVKEQLAKINFTDYEDVLFIGKSVGTVVAVAYANEMNVSARCILYTPVNHTFSIGKINGIAFHGTGDAWAQTDVLVKACEQMNVPIHLIEGANHSLEIKNVLEDVACINRVMGITEQFIK